MKNSKGELLQQPYLDLALMRREQAGRVNVDVLINAFTWIDTLEGGIFWGKVNNSSTPAIPAASLAELEAWEKAKHPYNEIAAYQEDPPAQNSEPDYKAMYEQLEAEANELTAALKELGAKYDELKAGDPSRNWVAECAMAILSNTPAGVEASWWSAAPSRSESW